MGRPRNDTTEMSATEKIETAFWDLLESSESFPITILQLTKKTGLNRNTIYYHYENIEDLASKALHHAISEERVLTLMNTLLQDQPPANIDDSLFLNARKIHLLAKSGSPFLQKLVKDTLIDAWTKAFRIDKTALNDMDQVNINFIAAGVISMLSNEQIFHSSHPFRHFPKSPLGQSVIQTLQAMPKAE